MAKEPPAEGANDAEPSTPRPVVVLCVMLFVLWNLVLATLHAVFPARIDLITIILAEIAILPALIFLFRELEIGYGDWRIKLYPITTLRRAFATLDELSVRVTTEVSEPAIEAAVKSELEPKRKAPDGLSPLDSASDQLIFARLSNEINERLKKIASNRRLSDAESNPAAILRGLVNAGVITPEESAAFISIMAAGLTQRAGGVVPPEVAQLARIEGPRLLETLDRLAMIPLGEIIEAAFQRAKAAGKEARLQGPAVIDDDLTFPGILVPNEVVVAFRLAAASRLTMSAALATLRKQMEVDDVSCGILVMLRAPPTEFTGPEGLKMDGFRFGFAWWTGANTFDGDRTARELAPWMFTPKA